MRHTENIPGSDIVAVAMVGAGRAVEEAAGLGGTHTTRVENFRAFSATARIIAGGAARGDGDHVDA